MFGDFHSKERGSESSDRQFFSLPAGNQPLASMRDARGLPERDHLLDLAKTYLEYQRSFWPDLFEGKSIDAEAMPEPMADQFASNYRLGRVAIPELISNKDGTPPKWGTAYVRYSDDNSNPRSLNQQLELILKRAAEARVFIPWEFVFADSAVTATQAMRRGYRLVKLLVEQVRHRLTHLFVDELGRANRRLIESRLLYDLVQQFGCRLIGVSDSFDSNSENSKILLTMLSMINEQFIDQLKAKVNRGMRDAFKRNLSTGKPPFGYRLVPAFDEKGRVITGKDGIAAKRPEVHPENAEIVREIFRLYVKSRLSPQLIAGKLNEKNAGGISWSTERVRATLAQELYVGRRYYGKRRYHVDPETGRQRLILRPENEWLRDVCEELRIINDPLWSRAQKLLEQRRRAYRRSPSKKPKRCRVYPKTLIRPVCDHCGRSMVVGHSGRYSNFVCPNSASKQGSPSCRGHKSRTMVENTVLAHVAKTLFSPEYVERLTKEANQRIRELAKEPKPDLRSLQREIDALSKRIDRLTQAIEIDSEGDLSSLVRKSQEYERSRKSKQKELKRLQQFSALKPELMKAADVEQLLGELRSLLAGDIALAAEVFHRLLGEIRLRKESSPGMRKPRWYASFVMNSASVLLEISRAKNLPIRRAMEYLCARDWKFENGVQLSIDHSPVREEFERSAIELLVKGYPSEEVARRLGVGLILVYTAATQASRNLPLEQLDRPRPSDAPIKELPVYARYAEIVVEERDRYHETFKRIARRLKVRSITAISAYHFGKKQRGEEVIERHAKPLPHLSLLSLERKKKIEELFLQGKTPSKIASTIGCSAYHVKKIVRHFQRWHEARGREKEIG